MKDEEYNLWLCSIPGLGIRKLLLLEAEIGTPEQIYRAGEARLVKIKGISARDAVSYTHLTLPTTSRV